MRGALPRPGPLGAGRAARIVLVLALAAAPAQALEAVPAAGPDRAAPLRIGVRVGNHPGFGRIVFDSPSALAYRVERLDEQRIALRFHAPGGLVLDLPAASRLPRHVAGLAATGDGADILLRPGVQPRHFRLADGRVVLDLADAPPAPGQRPQAAEGASRDGGAGEGPRASPARAAQRARSPERGREPPGPAPTRGAADRPRHEGAAGAISGDATRPAARAGGAAPAASSVRGASAPAAAAPDGRPGPHGAEPLPAPSAGKAVDGAAAPAGDPVEAPPPRGPLASVAAPSAPSPSGAADAPAGPGGGVASAEAGGPAAPAAARAPDAAPPAAATPVPGSARAPSAPPPRPVRLVPAPEAPGRALLLPFGPEVGAAAFRRGDAAIVVFDAAAPLDLGALAGDPLFGAAEAWTSGDATVLRLRLAAPARLVPRPAPDRGGWLVEARPEGLPGLRVLVPEAEPEPPRLVIRAARPGRAVVLADPATGAPLLVGTVREGGQALLLARRGAQFDLLPSALGAVVLARSDALVLRAGPDRFTLSAAGGAALILGEAWRTPPLAAEAAAMSRVLDLRPAGGPTLAARLRDLRGAIAAAPPLARAPLRREATETLLALGLAPEAQAMASLAFQEAPQARDDPRLLLAHGAAALLAGRIAEAAPALEDHRLPETDETLLWRGLLAAARDGAAEAAPALAATAPLLLTYPEALRARLLAPAAEALIEAGGAPALALARRLLEGDEAAPGLALARARLAEAEGRVEEALAGYDAVARGRDRLARARAIRRAVELRLATGALDAAGAAAALEAALYAWRGDALEREARMRLAALKRQAGDAEGAFVLLQEVEAQSPADAAALRPLLREALLEAMAKVPPLAAVALADARRDLLPEAGEEGVAAVTLLADRLVALDLTERAAGLLHEAAAGSATPAARAALGTRLAALRLREGDAAGALAALEETAAEPLPAPLATEREVLRARALARRGDRDAAAALLRGLGAAGAAPLAELLAEAEDWPGAAAALAAHLAATLPASPAPLAPEHRRALARLAAFAALAGDEARLAALRADYGARMRDGPLAETFAMLTADPPRGLADLPRLQRELELIRALPSRLEALRTGAPVTR